MKKMFRKILCLLILGMLTTAIFSQENIFILGTKDSSDAEFLQSNYQTDFFPNSQPVGELTKEVNINWYPDQYIHFSLLASSANRGITFILDPAWNDGSGTLKISIEVWVDNNWQEVDRTVLNMTEAGYIDIPPSFLKEGMNDIKIHAISGTGDTTIVTWDQIKCIEASFTTVWTLGTNNGSSSEFDQYDYEMYFNIDNDPINEFPKEIDINSHQNQYITFILTSDECQKAKNLSFDVFGNDGDGELIINIDKYDGVNWKTIGSSGISQHNPKKINICVDDLEEGVNNWRISAVSGSNGTTTVQWDSISFYERDNLPEAVTLLLEEILDTSLNYFLSPQAIHSSGLPLTALKCTDRARYGYSNPTEWGYALQAWVAAAERGLIGDNDACNKIDNALTTMFNLQLDSEQFKYGLFYPYYILTDAYGNDVPFPYHAADPRLPSGDCALLYGSINVAEGWLRLNGYTSTADKALNVKSNMNFHSCYLEVSQTEAYIHHQINANTGELSAASWNIYADEGGMVAFIAYQSGSISFEEYKKVLDSQWRDSAEWNGHFVREAAYYNMMFTWAQRSLVGYPMFGNSKERIYGVNSFVPNMMSHLDYGEFVEIDYPAFSAAMTQTHEGEAMVGWEMGLYVRPNLIDKDLEKPLSHVSPHALFVPCSGINALDENTIKRLFEKWVLLKCDTSCVWHPSYSQDPFGFEVVASPYINRPEYNGADEGRYIFETLSESYTALSIYDGLKRCGDGRTFYYFATHVQGYDEKVSDVLNYAYRYEDLENLELTNMTINTDTDYSCLGYIYARSFTIQNSANVTFTADNMNYGMGYIKLDTGFKVELGSTFKACIGN